MFIDLFLVTILLICLYTDLKTNKIYNDIIYPALFVAFFYHFANDGIQGLGFSFMGFSIGLAILLIPYLLGGMGAGDVKLLSLIGALKGMTFVIYSSVYMALIGGVLALGVLLLGTGAKKRLKALLYLPFQINNGIKISTIIEKETLTKKYPYGVAITGGAFLALFGLGGSWV